MLGMPATFSLKSIAFSSMLSKYVETKIYETIIYLLF